MLQWNKYLFPLFLSTLSSCTLASDTDEELRDELNNMAMRAIARFSFQRVQLDYIFDEDGNGVCKACFSVFEEDYFVRITLRDNRGLRANTNAYFVEDLFKEEK